MKRSCFLIAGVLTSLLLGGQTTPKNARKHTSPAACCAMCTRVVAQGAEMGCCAQMGATAADAIAIAAALEAQKTELDLTSEQISKVAGVLAKPAAPMGGCCHRAGHARATAEQ